MQIVDRVHLSVEKNEDGGSLRWMLKASWTPTGLAERQLILHSSTSGWETSYRLSALDAMLRHAYEQGRADQALGF